MMHSPFLEEYSLLIFLTKLSLFILIHLFLGGSYLPDDPVHFCMIIYICGVTNKGEVHCWGKNDKGQVGDGTNEDRDVPTPISF
jgi:hypothetical protein